MFLAPLKLLAFSRRDRWSGTASPPLASGGSVQGRVHDTVKHQVGMIDLGGAEGGHQTCGLDQRAEIYHERLAGL